MLFFTRMSVVLPKQLYSRFGTICYENETKSWQREACFKESFFCVDCKKFILNMKDFIEHVFLGFNFNRMSKQITWVTYQGWCKSLRSSKCEDDGVYIRIWKGETAFIHACIYQSSKYVRRRDAFSWCAFIVNYWRKCLGRFSKLLTARFQSVESCKYISNAKLFHSKYVFFKKKIFFY